jgi:hypothetical protein
MNKKILVIVGLAAVIAVSAGVISMTGDSFERGSDFTRSATEAFEPVSDETPAISDQTDGADVTETPVEDTVVTEETEAPQDEPTLEPGNDVNNYQDELVSVSSYSVRRVIDHTTGEECTPREIFGKQYYLCRLSFYSDGRLELLLNPSSDDLREGRYSIYDDVVSVLYGDGSGAEYTILTDENGEIGSIVVNYGDFDVYFGQ